MSFRILVVDDEPNIVNILRSNLEREGYKVLAAYDGEEALKLAATRDPHLILLDCMLPGVDGFDVCKTIRRDSTVPIIMLTAKSEEIDKILGLELGADDYITKPFSVREVLARVKAQLRRVSLQEDRAEQVSAIRIGEIVIDQNAYQVTVGGEPAELTLREYELVRFLASHAGQVFTREELLENVWEYEYYGDVRTVDVTVRRAREKIEPDPEKFRYLLTKRGVGYYFSRNPDESGID
ncbi:MAG TPA: response regulator [Bacillota bacterium]|jgi:two-component system response regulator VicR|nr:response regulator transcription factor [Fastidiosipila sp.]HPX93873.1 response regulator [Bacillota bacterium]HQB81437.1 response regulator [Bacillota bacterium]